MTIDSIGLTQDLVRFPSLNPPGEEQACIDHLARLLSDAWRPFARAIDATTTLMRQAPPSDSGMPR